MLKVYRICTACEIPHYENCETCFGWGVYSNQAGDIVSAAEAMYRRFKGPVYACPECGSDENGPAGYSGKFHVRKEKNVYSN